MKWPVKGRPPIISNDSFMKAVNAFEQDEGRAVGSKDMDKVLKDAKIFIAKEGGASTLFVVSPTSTFTRQLYVLAFTVGHS